jgi:secreted PhoX family phosphatase
MAGVLGIGIPIMNACQITRVDFGALAASGVPNLHIPAGFTARKLASSGAKVKRGDGSDTAYTWHTRPDGGGVFPILEAGVLTGWVYTSNSESTPGGTGAIKFDAAGNVVDAYSILSGTSNNCAGGVLPFAGGWRWISCEEVEDGRAFECDPFVAGNGVARPAMGRFYREAVAADIDELRIYQTEDRTDGAFYRFTPTVWGDLTAGLLEVMIDLGGGAVGWAEVPDPDGNPTNTRSQVPVGGGTIKRFNGGEGIWYTDGNVYFTTKGDNRVWRYTPATNVLTIVYDDTSPFPSPRHLTGADNLVATTTNRVFVAEDGGNMEIVGLDVATGATYPIIRYDVTGSEIAGPAFSPDGTRLYFSSQSNPGETFEVAGPWNQNAPA